MKILKEICMAVLTAFGYIIVMCVVSALAVGALGFDDSSWFVGTAFETFAGYALMLPRMNAHEDWRIGRRMIFFAWLFIAMCGVKMFFVVF